MCFIDDDDTNTLGGGMIEIFAGVTIAVITFGVLLFVCVIWCQWRYMKYDNIIMSRKLTLQIS